MPVLSGQLAAPQSDSNAVIVDSNVWATWQSYVDVDYVNVTVGTPGARQELMFQRADTAAAGYWTLDGVAQVGNGSIMPLGPGSPDWRLAGIGDLTGTGMNDLVWQSKSTGGIGYWIVNGPALVSTGTFSPSNSGSPGWRVVGLVDLNGDHSPDLIFQNVNTGDISYWLLNGTVKTSGGLFSPSNPGSSWSLVGAYHNYGTATTTLYFQNTQTGNVQYWVMNSSQTMTSSGQLSPANNGSASSLSMNYS
ncbi:MAG TPA: hypothetical protein VGS41_09525 [Chthonomonadales bacterium]|nr:hypothetical protein [Chthonomonadales bacterium]